MNSRVVVCRISVLFNKAIFRITDHKIWIFPISIFIVYNTTIKEVVLYKFVVTDESMVL